MIRFLIYRPISVIVIYVALCLLAVLSIRRIPISLLPDIDIPQITVLVEQSNYSVREMENQILKPLRSRLLQVDGIESMEGLAGHEFGMIRLRFAYGRDIDYAFLEVNEKVDQSLNSLPKNIDRPRVVKAGAGELPAFYLSVSYKQGEETGPDAFARLSELADQVIRRRLEQLESVALADLSGLSARQIIIEPKEQLLINLGITQSDIQQALEMANLNMGSIKVRERQYEYLVRLGQNLSSVGDVRETVLRIGERVFSLRELADITLSERPPAGLYFFNNRRGVSLAVIKNSAARMEELERSVDEMIADLEREHSAIHFEKGRDQLFLLNYALENLRQSLLLGGFMAMIIVFLFYRNWRVPVIIVIIIPLSVLLSLLFFDAFGLSINIISLSGLILGLGLMIDNGIIVLDNISQLANEGKTSADACITGVNEMIRPLLSSMLTTCSVFFPLIFLSGISGALFYAQALAVSIGLTISYLVSISLLPVLYFVLHKKQEPLRNRRKPLLAKLYDRGFQFTFKHPAVVLGAAALTVLAGWYIAQRLPMRQLPALPQTAFELYLDWNENIRPEAAQERVEQIFSPFSDTSLHYYAHIAQQQYLLNYDPLQKAGIVHFYVETGSEARCQEIQRELKTYIEKQFPVATYQFLPGRTLFEQLFPSGEADLNAGLRLPANATEEEALSSFRQLSDAFAKAFPHGTLTPPVVEDRILLVPKMERLLFYQLTGEQLFQELKRALGNRELMVLKNFHASVPVVISGPRADLDQLLQTFQIKTKEGNWIPVHQLVSPERIKSLKYIHASRNGEYLPLGIEGVSPNALLTFFNDYERRHPGLKFEFSGAWFKNRQLFFELLAVLGVSILLLYFIMAAQFESLLQPIIILLEIPVSLGGCLLFLYLGGESLNAMAFIGMVVTAGIIVNDSIIKIDTINRLRNREDYTVLKAIHEGGLRRLNPIVMTSLTSILAVLPFLWGGGLGAGLQKPIALALIGGMIVGTMVSLFLIPLIYSFFYRDVR